MTSNCRDLVRSAPCLGEAARSRLAEAMRAAMMKVRHIALATKPIRSDARERLPALTALTALVTSCCRNVEVHAAFNPRKSDPAQRRAGPSVGRRYRQKALDGFFSGSPPA